MTQKPFFHADDPRFDPEIGASTTGALMETIVRAEEWQRARSLRAAEQLLSAIAHAELLSEHETPAVAEKLAAFCALVFETGQEQTVTTWHRAGDQPPQPDDGENILVWASTQQPGQPRVFEIRRENYERARAGHMTWAQGDIPAITHYATLPKL